MKASKSPFGIFFLAFTLIGCSGPAYRSRVLDTPETRGLKGHQKPYEVNGTRYDPLRDHSGYAAEGIASWYGADFHGRPTSNGEIYDMHAQTAAHKTLPLGVWVRVTSLRNGKSTEVRVNDRGPFVKGRLIDLSFAAAKALDVVAAGTAPVRIEALGYRDGGTTSYRKPERYDIGPFTVQVGAFTIADNARRLADQLKTRHGHASIQETWVRDRRFYRVRAGRYDSIDAAERARSSFETGGYPNSFVVAIE